MLKKILNSDLMRITTYKTEMDDRKHNILVMEKSYDIPKKTLNCPKTVAEMLNSIFRLNRQAEEYIYMIALNTKSQPLGVFEISHGTVNQSICNPRDIFIKALLCGAVNIILAHNHPSGDVCPSKEDIDTYRRVKESGQILGITLLDNIVIRNGYFSFAEQGLQ